MASMNSALLDEVLLRQQGRSAVFVDSKTDEGTRFQLKKSRGESVRAVFRSMCGWELKPSAIPPYGSRLARFQLSGIIGISGPVNATLIVNIHQDLAFAAAERMIGNRPEAIDADTLDLVGELANMIGGNTKERMGMAGLRLGLPTVVAGEGHIVAYDKDAEVSFLPFESDYGPLVLEIAIA